jgi:uncharacterized protein (DUF849 family)
MLLQATLNGPFGKQDHASIPITAEELAADAVECARAGARAFHIHPRDRSGVETLEPRVVDTVSRTVRDRSGWPVGVTTGAWIEPDPARRAALVRGWHQPDFTSVNLSEAGAVEVMRAALAAGVGIEAGVWSVSDARALARSGLGDRLTRVLIEPIDVAASDAVAIVAEIHTMLDQARIVVPRLQHGDGESTWVLIEDAVSRGVDTRVGFEDTLLLPDGRRASRNAQLVEAAHDLGAGEPA